MKRILAFVLTLALVLTSMQMLFISADETTAVAVAVTADESWTEATYDPSTGYLTNVTDGYYFAVTLNSSKQTFTMAGVSGYVIDAPKVVIPYKFIYNNVEYKFASAGGYLLTGKASNTAATYVEEIVVSEGIEVVGSSTFRNLKGLTTVKLPSTIKTLDSNSFAGDSKLATINLPEGLTTLGSGALQFTGFTSITVPSTVTSFGGSQFYGCSKLTQVNLLFPYTVLPGSTFRGCTSLASYTFPEGVTEFGSLTFSQTALTEIVIPATITAIPKQAFSVTKSLATVTVEGEITEIGSEAFKNCSGLRTLNLNGKTVPTIASTNAFTGVKNLVVNYPADGEGYDSADWQAMFPAGTTFVRAEGEPSVKDLVLSGRNVVETILTTTYTYYDPMGRAESGSVAVWEGCEEADFESSEVFTLKTQDCSATNPPSYTIQETDDGKYIRVTITPKNADTKLNTGKPVSAQLDEKVRLPQTIPTVALTAPSNGYVVNCNNEVNLSATAVCDNTIITKVEFYANDVVVAEALTDPYDATWTPTEMGSYSIYAKAYNAIGEDQSTDPVTVTVLSEDATIDSYITIEFTSPVADSFTLTGSDVTFTANVAESSGSEITSVEIFANGKSIHTATSGEINFTKTFEAGKYTITATAKSADGKTGYSSPFDINVSGMGFTKMMSDNMVLQRNRDLKLTGYGVDGTVVTAQLLDKTASATVSGGMWQIKMPPMPTTQSTTLTFTASDGTSKTFNNVAIGEVIICSGQSNMTGPIGNQHSFASGNPQPGIRIFKTGSGSASSPNTDVASGTWDVSATSLIKTFSSVGYLTGYNYFMSQNGEVPVGLIQSAVSGTGINLWVPNDAFDYDPDLKKLDKSTTHYNYMIAPWTGYTIGHIVWYQGESDSHHSRFYEKSLAAYIQSYREKFEDDGINFIIVQLPVFDAVVGYGSSSRSFWIVREGEYNIGKHVEGVETAITIDTGSISSVHPGGKDKVGQRTALILQHFASPDPDLVWKSPNYDYYEIVGDKAVIHFNDVGAGLTTIDGLAPKAFKVAGDDMNFVDATATLVGNTVEVDISGVVGTPNIRYACEDVPNRTDNTWSVNLVNSAGLPMAPFRTDDAKIQFKSYDSATDTYSDPYNFTPMIKGITAGNIVNGTSVIEIDAHGFDDDVKSVELFIDGNSAGQAVQSEENEDIWTFNWTAATEGSHSFYAIATDEFDLTSVKVDPAFGTTSVTPRSYTYNLVKENTDITVTYDDTNGAVANTTLDGVLIIAAYNNDDVLIKIEIAQDGAKTASIAAADIKTATVIKAFVFENLENIKPLGISASTIK